jgi:Spy/CpxP family protein refolding chaperone
MNKSKRSTLAALAGGAAAAVSFAAFARPGRHGGQHGPMDPAQMEQHLDRMLKHLYVEIDATEEQKQKLDPIVKDAAKELAPIRRNLREARREAIGLLAQDKVDASAIEALRTKQMQLADQASRRFTGRRGRRAQPGAAQEARRAPRTPPRRLHDARLKRGQDPFRQKGVRSLRFLAPFPLNGS